MKQAQESRTSWIVARGCSMQPQWDDGARLLVKVADLRSLKTGDLVVYQSGDKLIAHRLIRRKSGKQSHFQTKADNACLPEPWQSEANLRFRIIAIESQGKVRWVGAGWERFFQRLSGWRERARAFLHELPVWAGAAKLPVTRSIIPESAASQTRRLNWARNQLLRSALSECLQLFRTAGFPTIALKGQALIARGVYTDEERSMGDIDVLVPKKHAERALELLVKTGWKPRTPQALQRMTLDDQVLLENSQGVLLDLHWSIVNGGWRFRNVVRVDEPGLWSRARQLPTAVGVLPVLGCEDQFLHLCMHLVLSGCSGRQGWEDIARFLAHEAEGIDWQAVILRSSGWRVRTQVWLALDTLWHRWGIIVPVLALRQLRPVLWRRWVLRALLPKDVAQVERESRLMRHLRELLLMDRWQDVFYLIGCWSRPPQDWWRLAKAGRSLFGAVEHDTKNRSLTGPAFDGD